MAATKIINLTKVSAHYDNLKIYHTKVSLHKYFQIYSNMHTPPYQHTQDYAISAYAQEKAVFNTKDMRLMY